MDRSGNEDNPRGAGRRRTPTGGSQHLDSDTISAFIDDALDREEREAVSAHLATCAACRQELAEISATVGLLHELPRYRPHRSFQIDANTARRERGNVVWLGRYLPALPALRAATAAVALLFLGTIAADVVTESEPSSNESFTVEQAPAPADQEETFIATATNEIDPSDENFAGDAADQTEIDAPAGVQADETEDQDQSAAMETAGETADEAAPAGAQSESQSRAAAAAAPEPTATPTPASTATPVPTLSPTPTPASEGFGSGIGDEFPWRVAEVIFGVTLLLLVVVLIALQRLRRRIG